MIEKHKKSTAVIILLVLAICAVLLAIWLHLSGNGRLSSLKVTFLKVGKADAIVTQIGNETVVIDTGEEDDGEELTAFLKNQAISYVDTLIITHYDKDHIGGADTLAESIEIGRIILPDYQGNGTEYFDFMNVIERKSIKLQYITQPTEFQLGDAYIKVEPPLSYETENTADADNNFSLITTITHGENTLIFTGDAQKQRIREWLLDGDSRSCDVLKIPHHGVYNTALQELLNATSPKYAVICSSDKNPAQTQTIELLKQYNVQVFQTKDGNVTIISDGKQIELHQKTK